MFFGLIYFVLDKDYRLFYRLNSRSSYGIMGDKYRPQTHGMINYQSHTSEGISYDFR